MDQIIGLDYAAYYHYHAHRASPGQEIMSAVATLGGYPVLAAVVLLGVFLMYRQKRIPALYFLISNFLAGVVLVEIAKAVIRQPRPDDWTGPLWQGFSFPSAPAMLSFIVYGSLLFLLPQRPRWRFLMLASAVGGLIVMIAYSVIYLGHHFVSDVLAGWLGGLMVLFLGMWCLTQVQVTRRGETG